MPAEDRPRVLMCSPSHFGVEYVINPWMAGHIGQARRAPAGEQWETLRSHLQTLADVTVMEGEPGLPDLCFTANAGFVLEGKAVVSRFRVQPRMPESAIHKRWLNEIGLEVVTLPDDQPFEGEGDALVQPGGLDGKPVVWAGYGVRSCLESHRTLAELFDVEVLSLRLIDPRFYHLDTCLFPLPEGRLVYFPGAFGERSLGVIRDRVPADRRVEVGEDDAARFACNALRIGGQVVLNDASPELRQRLEAWGYGVTTIRVDEFMLAGGAVKCLSLLLDQELGGAAEPRPRVVSAIRGTRLTLSGHLLDRGLLNRTLDTIEAAGGSFQLEQLRPAARRDQASHATIRVAATDQPHLDQIIERLRPLGAHEADPPVNAHCAAVTQDGVAPEGFYTTTIYPTDVRVGGRWLRAADQRMDAALVVAHRLDGTPTASCVLMRDLRAGDQVVVGEDGLRVATPAEPGPAGGREFGFMSAGVSSERRVEQHIDTLAREMRRIKERRGKIVVVAGPVVVHTGGAAHLAQIIRDGYVHALLTGNALPVHDIELNLFGTSLGVDLRHGAGVRGGHQHHLRAINTVRQHGGIEQAVDAGVVTAGVMHECVKAGVPYVLAGSIRDDGPLPETLMDLTEAQRAYARAIRGADMILMLSSMLHAIGTGNMTPAGVRLVCVDISPAVVTKLADRGSVESTGIVTDVGLFLNLLAGALRGG